MSTDSSYPCYGLVDFSYTGNGDIKECSVPKKYSLYEQQNGLRYADSQRVLNRYGNAHRQLLHPQKILINNDASGMPRIKPDGTYGGGCYYNGMRGIKAAIAFNPQINCMLNVQMKPYARTACCPVVRVNIFPKAPCCEKPTVDGGAVRTYRPNPRIIPSHHA